MATDRTHIMRLAVQDVLESSVRGRAIRTKRRDLFTLYLLLLLHLHEQGGELPADPEALADKVVLFEPDEIAALLPELEELGRQPGKRGGVRIEAGRLSNQRVSEDLGTERDYREEQSRIAKEARNKDKPKGTLRLPSGQPEAPLSPPAPAPLPAPFPAPAPTPAPLQQQQQQQTAAVPHDPSDPAQADMAVRLEAVSRYVSDAEHGGPLSPLEVLAKLSRTPRGAVLSDLRDRSKWVRRTAVELNRLERQITNSGAHLLPAGNGPPDESAVSSWLIVLGCLEARVNRHTFACWYRTTNGEAFIGDNRDVLLVRAPSSEHAQWLRANSGTVAEAVHAVGLTCKVEFFAAVLVAI